MGKILKNIEGTWWRSSESSLRNPCITHVRNNNSWRFIVSTHQMKGVYTRTSGLTKVLLDC